MVQEKLVHIYQAYYIIILYHIIMDIMSIKKNKTSKTLVYRSIYTALSLIVALNIIAFPSLSLFPFQWALLLGSLLVNILINKTLLKCIAVIIILLLSVTMLFMDIIGCLFFTQNVFLLSFFSFFSILNILVSVKLLIDGLTSFSIK